VRAKAKAKEEKFARHQNIERYRRLPMTTIDHGPRERLVDLIGQAKQKQKEAGDSGYQYY
jgi:hypothetical protein